MLLTPYRVPDVTGPLGFLTGRILSDLGADVVKIEPPGGDPARHLEPRLGSTEAAGDSLVWLALNAGKRALTLDLTAREARERFRELATGTDFLLESFSPGTLEAWGLGYEVLARSNPGLILVSITPFGQNGPYCHFAASDLEIMALSGAMSLAGEADEEPMRIGAPQSAMWVGAEAAMGALTALAHRAVTGEGQHVDVSAQAAVLSALAHAPAFWDLTRVNPERSGIYITGRSITGAKMRVFWRCRDGWINFIIYGGSAGRHTNEQLVAWMAERRLAPDWLIELDWTDVRVPELTQEEVDRLETPIARFMATLTKQEFLDGAIARQMLGYPVSSVADISRDPQLEARRFWQEIEDARTAVPMRYPGGFAVVDGERLQIAGPAPLRDEAADRDDWGPTTRAPGRADRLETA